MQLVGKRLGCIVDPHPGRDTQAATGAEFPRWGERDTQDQARQPTAQVAGSATPAAGSVTRRYLRPTLPMTPRWRRTG
jgi:hypothetical protein